MRAISRNTLFFATPDDMRQWVSAVEESCELQYIETGLFDSPEQPLLYSLLEDPMLGKAAFGNYPLEKFYLVSRRGASITIRPVPQRRGGTKYAIDQLENPHTITLGAGGIFQDKFIIEGQLGTVSKDPESSSLFQLFSRKMRGSFTVIKGYKVGRFTEKLMNEGWRLVHSAKAPPEYYLMR